MVVQLCGMVLGICATTSTAVFLIHPGSKPNRASGMRANLLNDADNVHRDPYACGVVESPGSQIPGIQVPGDNHDLLRDLVTFQISDDVVALFRSKIVWGKHNVHLDYPPVWRDRTSGSASSAGVAPAGISGIPSSYFVNPVRAKRKLPEPL